MVGENDARAFGAGTDVAMESADMVLMKSNPFDVVGAIELSHVTLGKIHQNLWWAVGYNVIACPLAAGALYPVLLGPSIAALAMSGSSALVAINASDVEADQADWHPSPAREPAPREIVAQVLSALSMIEVAMPPEQAAPKRSGGRA
jgi:hypothetical protein